MAGLKRSVVWYADIRDLYSIADTAKSHLSDAECARIAEFRFEDDQKRSLLSTLLQHSCIRHRLCPDGAALVYEIARVPEGKPYLKVDSIVHPSASTATDEIQQAPLDTWNYNVSHHGRYVCIASHPHLLIGVDIVDLTTRSPRLANTASEYIQMFDKVLHPNEQDRLSCVVGESEKYTLFFTIWCLKEAYIKAIGIGLGLDLKDIEARIECKTSVREESMVNEKTSESSGEKRDHDEEQQQKQQQQRGTARVYVGNEHCSDWFFEYFPLDDTHIMSVALGPLSGASESYKRAAWGHVSRETMAEQVQECDEALKRVRMGGIFSVLPAVKMQSIQCLVRGVRNVEGEASEGGAGDNETIQAQETKEGAAVMCVIL